MLDPMRGVLKVLEYIHEKFPGMANLYRNGHGFPPAIKIEGIEEEFVDTFIRPVCKEVEKDYAFKLPIDFDPEGVHDGGGNKREVMPVCYIYIDDPLEIGRLCLDEMNSAWVTPVDIAVEHLRGRVYNIAIAKG